MRLLLFIPTIILFLSNVPFFKEVPMVVAEECSKQSSCEEELKMKDHCGKQREPQQSQKDDCCKKMETTCVCICCFQFAGTAYRIDDHIPANDLSRVPYPGFLNDKYKDPELPSVYNPPDLV